MANAITPSGFRRPVGREDAQRTEGILDLTGNTHTSDGDYVEDNPSQLHETGASNPLYGAVAMPLEEFGRSNQADANRVPELPVTMDSLFTVGGQSDVTTGMNDRMSKIASYNAEQQAKERAEQQREKEEYKRLLEERKKRTGNSVSALRF